MSSEPGNSVGGLGCPTGITPRDSTDSTVTEPDAPDSNSDLSTPQRGVPTPEERIQGLLDRYHDKMFTAISEQHGRKLREEALEEPEEVVREVEIGESETREVRETQSRSALPLVAVMEEFLDWYESYRDKWLRMAKGDGWREAREEFLVELDNSFQPEYQKQTYARLQALRRQTAGGEYPDGSECPGAFGEPVTVLFGLTSSGTRGDGSPRPIVDHAREVREAWSGSADSVKRTLRYVLEDKLGLESSEYAWWFQSEPHPGDGANAGYSHAHPVVVFDRAAASVEEVEAEMFRSVVAKHVAECPGAEWSAHDLDESVTVKEPGEIEDFAQYVSEYVAVSPEEDLLERSDEYLMYAAANWASTSQKYSKSGTATAAINADRCHQQYVDEEARQDADHGEEVTRRDGEVVCWNCGESFGVEQTETLAERRMATDGGAASSAGREAGGGRASGEGAELVDLWQDAKAAASVGGPTAERECSHPDGSNTCPLCAESTGAVAADVPIPESAEPPTSVEESSESFGRRPASWSPDAIVHLSSGEETAIGTPGGTAYGEVVVGGVESIGAKIERGHLLPSWLEGPEPWNNPSPGEDDTVPITEEEIRSGELPPPELVHKEYAELHARQTPTPKEWSDDWYAERYERGSGEESSVDRERVREYVRTHQEVSVVEVMGRLSIGPEERSVVEEIVAE